MSMVIEILSELPKDFQLPLIKAFTALREELADAVRREDFNQLKATVQELAEAQKRTESRVEELAEAQKRTEARVEELAEAQKRTEARVEELAEAQKRTEQRLDSLTMRVEELAEAQKRTEARVEELAEAQKRTEQRLDSLTVRVEELAEAQKRTEHRLDSLTMRVEELAIAQKQTQEQINRLVEVQERLLTKVDFLDASLTETRKMVAGLSDSVGYGLEDRAIRSLSPLLKERYGLQVKGKLCRKYLLYQGGSEEVNIYGEAEREGNPVILVGEAKAHLSIKHIDRFLKQIERLKALGAIQGEVFPFMVSYSIRPEVESYAQEKSVALFYSYEIEL
jgi:chromosome segregation ATPase